MWTRLRSLHPTVCQHRSLVVKLCSTSSSSATNEAPLPEVNPGKPTFGLVFDIDGVIARGRDVIPAALHAFRQLVDANGNFRVPTTFVTNASNNLKYHKAEQLSEWLGLPISSDQVVMAHSPLKWFTQYHHKHVLVSGQGPVEAIALNLGFTNVCTIDSFRRQFPALDVVDHSRRTWMTVPSNASFPPIEAVVLLGEPVRWETSLQLLVDVLMSDGLPLYRVDQPPLPHLPVLACNMDLQWMAGAPMPRFGHGAFLTCLEALFRKITGHTLTYSALVGKPCEITYHYAVSKVETLAEKSGNANPIRHIYCIGDNVNADVFGANLYNQFLENRATPEPVPQQRNYSLLNRDGTLKEHRSRAERCFSVLVQTGVHFGPRGERKWESDHSPRDFLPVDERLLQPDFDCRDVHDAIQLIFEREGFANS